MSLLLMITFLLTIGYINSMSLPSIQQQQQQFEPLDNIIDTSDIFSDNLSNELKNNKIFIKKILQDSHMNLMNSGGSDSIDGFTNQEIKKRRENNNLKNSEDQLDYQKNFDNCNRKCYADYKLFDDDYDILIQKYKAMQNLLASLGPNYLEAFSKSGRDSSGRREGPLYAEEPRYVVVPKEVEGDMLGSSGFKDFFIPPRGRKQMPLLEKIKNHYELFVPNRGKKATNTKKDKIKDIFKYNDLFFPNRGKKSISTFEKN